jgi:hypothetical protein
MMMGAPHGGGALEPGSVGHSHGRRAVAEKSVCRWCDGACGSRVAEGADAAVIIIIIIIIIIVVVVAVLVVLVIVVPATDPSAIVIVVIVSAHTDEGHRLVVRTEHGSANAAALVVRVALDLHRSKGRQAERNGQGRRREKQGKSGCHGVVSLNLMLPIWAPDLSGS